jgi:hypothetical protein
MGVFHFTFWDSLHVMGRLEASAWPVPWEPRKPCHESPARVGRARARKRGRERFMRVGGVRPAMAGERG